MNLILGAEVTDSAGEALGRVTKEDLDWILVEKSGVVLVSRVVMKDEIASIQPAQVRLLHTQTAMEARPDRPAVPSVKGESQP